MTNQSTKVIEATPERVALELLFDLRVNSPDCPKSNSPEYFKWNLDRFAECLEATKGRRSFQGKKPTASVY